MSNEKVSVQAPRRVLSFTEHVANLKTAAQAEDALLDAQRALTHLRCLLASWDECSESERIQSVQDALSRLDGSWSGRS